MSAQERLVVAFATSHAAEVARLADGDPSALSGLLAQLPRAAAAAVLRKSSVHSAARALADLPPERRGELVQELGLKAVAVLFSHLGEDSRKAVCESLPPSEATKLRSLASFPPDCAAAYADTDAITVFEQTSIADALAAVRQRPRAAGAYVYVLGDGQTLVGVATLRDLVCAKPEARVADVMTTNPVRVRGADATSLVLQNAGWRTHHALPVVDAEGRFVGVIGYERYRALEAELGTRDGQAPAATTASSLAEVFTLGASALLRWGAVTLTESGEER